MNARTPARTLARLALLALPLFVLGFNTGALAQQPAVASSAAPVDPAMAATAPPPYFDAKTLDLGRVLPPAPKNDSDLTRSEITLMLKIQKERSPAQAQRAADDAKVSVYRFADALGNPIVFNAKSLPKFDTMFRKVLHEEGAVIQAGKRSFARPRPFVLEPKIEPVVDKPPNDSYPSGHTMWARAVGLLLADMLPEYREKLIARADEYSFNRVVAGVHFPSDVEAGKLAGTALAAFLLASPAFQQDYADAKKELRAALKLAN